MGLRETFLLNLLGDPINPGTEETLQDILEKLQNLFPSESIIEFNTADTVARNAISTVLTYENTTGNDVWLDGFLAEGTVDAEYFLVINNSIKAVYRTSEQDRTAKYAFPVIFKVPNGTIINIKVEHHYDFTGDFSASLIMSKYNG